MAGSHTGFITVNQVHAIGTHFRSQKMLEGYWQIQHWAWDSMKDPRRGAEQVSKARKESGVCEVSG